MAGLKLVLPVLLLLCPPNEANLIGVSPTKLPQEGGTTLVLMGDSNGGLLAGSSAPARNATVPPNLVLCCDFNGDSAPIGGESVATLRSATRGSCVVPKVSAAGAAAVRLFLSVQKDCHGDKGPGGGWLTGQVNVQFSVSLLSFAPGRRPYVSESSGALVFKMAAEDEIRSWLAPAAAAGAANLELHTTAVLALPTGPRQLYAVPQPLVAGQASALPFELAGLPERIDATVTATVTVSDAASKRVLGTMNGSRLFQRFLPPPEGPPGGIVQLDRHRRALLVGGDVFQGVGWYIGGGQFTYNFTDQVDDMAHKGVNMIMVYSFERGQSISRPTPADLSAFLAHCSSVGVNVIFDFMPWFEDFAYCAANITSGCKLTETKRAFEEMVEAGAASKALLGWYICDGETAVDSLCCVVATGSRHYTRVRGTCRLLQLERGKPSRSIKRRLSGAEAGRCELPAII
jgi:hypothetical protein